MITNRQARIALKNECQLSELPTLLPPNASSRLRSRMEYAEDWARVLSHASRARFDSYRRGLDSLLKATDADDLIDFSYLWELLAINRAATLRRNAAVDVTREPFDQSGDDVAEEAFRAELAAEANDLRAVSLEVYSRVGMKHFSHRSQT